MTMEINDDFMLYSNSTRNETCLPFFTTNQIRKIMITAGTIGSTSLVLCVFALSLVLRYGLYKKPVYRLASYQVIGSILVSVVMVLATVPILPVFDKRGSIIHKICMVLGFLLEYVLWIKLLIALCLIFHIFCIGVIRKNFGKVEVYYIAFSLLFPLLFVWIPFTTKSFGLTQSWCWIKDSHCNARMYETGVIEQYSLWFGPLVLCALVSFIAIIIIVISFKYRYNKVMEVSTERDPLLENHVKKYMLNVYFRKLIPLLIYPIVFFLLFIFPTVRIRNHEALSSSTNFKLALAHTSIYCSFGFFSGVLLILHVLLVRRLENWSDHPNSKAFVRKDTLPDKSLTALDYN